MPHSINNVKTFTAYKERQQNNKVQQSIGLKMLSKQLRRRINYFFFSSTGTLGGVEPKQNKTYSRPAISLKPPSVGSHTVRNVKIINVKSKKYRQYNDQMKENN